MYASDSAAAVSARSASGKDYSSDFTLRVAPNELLASTPLSWGFRASFASLSSIRTTLQNVHRHASQRKRTVTRFRTPTNTVVKPKRSAVKARPWRACKERCLEMRDSCTELNAMRLHVLGVYPRSNTHGITLVRSMVRLARDHRRWAVVLEQSGWKSN